MSPLLTKTSIFDITIRISGLPMFVPLPSQWEFINQVIWVNNKCNVSLKYLQQANGKILERIIINEIKICMNCQKLKNPLEICNISIQTDTMVIKLIIYKYCPSMRAIRSDFLDVSDIAWACDGNITFITKYHGILDKQYKEPKSVQNVRVWFANGRG